MTSGPVSIARQGCARPLRLALVLTAALSTLAPTPPAFAQQQTAAQAGGPQSTALARALDRASVREWPAAQAAAAQAGGQAPALIEWLRLRAGGEEARLGDYEAFLQRHADWPGLQLVAEKGEAAVARSTTPARVVTYFASRPPRTAQGSLALIGAYLAQGRRAEAEAEGYRAWAELRFDAEQEQAMIGLIGPALVVAHEVRLDNMLWAGRLAEARRMLPRVSPDWRALAEARIAIQSDADGVDARIRAIPAALANDPGLGYDRFVWRMKRDRYDEAAELILQYSDSAAHLGRPEAWAPRRLLLSRWLMRNGKEREAYRVAARNHLGSGANYADLEFLSGFVALRKLGDADTALTHFTRLQAAVSTGISLSRAQYWQGRAQEARGDDAAARAAFAAAARHQTAFYGLLAAEKLGQTLDPAVLSQARPASGWQGAGFARSPVFAAARELLMAGDRQQAKRFLLHLAESCDATELDQLADMALSMGEPHVALLIAKQAAERGLILPRAYYPVPGMVPDGVSVSRALALAISRRESEFDPAVVSHAGARGLMQVMPGTAEMMAKKTGLPFEAARLTRDPAYNVAMGTAYLRELVDEFGPSIALVASGYNAGAGRPRRWIADFGDPRLPGTDVVDWIETIPFAETRTYVMRVAESVVIYRALLRGTPGEIRLTSELKG